MIELKNLTKTYELNKKNKVTAIKNINLSIETSKFIVLKGPSGSGKSTILSLIAGLSKPTTGEVIVEGKQISKFQDSFLAEYRQNTIGFIFQKYNLIPNLSVFENIIVPLIPLNLSSKIVEEKALKVMNDFNIVHKKNETVKNLSGGEQQRVAIARSQINNPKIVIADEPTANLDKQLSEAFIKTLVELKKQGKTIIVASHDPLFFDLEFCDKEIEVSNGEIII